MKKEDITILIPTFKRPNHLERLLDSFTLFEKIKDIPLYILDSSPKDYAQSYNVIIDKFKFKLNLTYFNYENDVFFSKKIFLGLKKVSTDYVLVATDDDMLNPNAVSECLDVLKIDNDTTNVTGETLRIEKDKNDNYITFYLENRVSNQENAIERGWHTSINSSITRITLNNVWRKKNLLEILEPITHDLFRKYTECMYDLLSSYTGKTILLNNLMVLRTKNPQRENYRSTSLPKFNEMRENVFCEKYFQSDLIRFLDVSENLVIKNSLKKIENKNLKSIFVRHFLVRYLHFDSNKGKRFIVLNFIDKFIIKYVFKVYKFFKIFLSLYTINKIFIFKSMIQTYGFSNTCNQMILDPKMKYNIFALKNQKTTDREDFLKILNSMKKYEKIIENWKI